mmetsp:Transcript_4123/g.9822  ORF Transcript_4123/g.9822 Transcript_4123/m.9822 type:complete len:310 (+) Transcript_4123:467-1396(+)
MPMGSCSGWGLAWSPPWGAPPAAGWAGWAGKAGAGRWPICMAGSCAGTWGGMPASGLASGAGTPAPPPCLVSRAVRRTLAASTLREAPSRVITASGLWGCCSSCTLQPLLCRMRLMRAPCFPMMCPTDSAGTVRVSARGPSSSLPTSRWETTWPAATQATWEVDPLMASVARICPVAGETPSPSSTWMLHPVEARAALMYLPALPITFPRYFLGMKSSRREPISGPISAWVPSGGGGCPGDWGDDSRASMSILAPRISRGLPSMVHLARPLFTAGSGWSTCTLQWAEVRMRLMRDPCFPITLDTFEASM